MQQGWVHLNRSVIDNWVHQDKPFCYFGAWVDLILMANHEARTMPAKGKLITINRGQLFTSLKSLSERWGWSKGKVERYLNMLENDTMVIKNRDANGTLLTLVNYDNYQGTRDANETQTERRRNSDGTQTGPNKNIKNYKNVKNDKKDIYSDSVTQIFDYLNQQTGKKYTGRSDAQRKQIIARLKEGYTVEEFKQVIDNKCREWKHDEKMQMYLRPETLFSTKFETYLNDTETERQRAKREEAEIHERQQKDLEETISYCDIETLFG